MNLYRLHTNPETLTGHAIAANTVPVIAWKKHRNDVQKLKNLEQLWTLDSNTSYWYAIRVLEGKFPEGETVIAQNAKYAYHYAADILHDRFEEGEAAIAQDAKYSYWYATTVIKGRFPEGESTIYADSNYSKLYDHYLRTLK